MYALLHILDPNEDGEITYAEFVQFVKNEPQAKHMVKHLPPRKKSAKESAPSGTRRQVPRRGEGEEDSGAPRPRRARSRRSGVYGGGRTEGGEEAAAAPAGAAASRPGAYHEADKSSSGAAKRRSGG